MHSTRHSATSLPHRCRTRSPLPMPVVAGPRGRSVSAMGVQAARLGERQHGRLDVRHWRRARLRVGRKLEEQRLDLLPRVRVWVRGRERVELATQDRPKAGTAAAEVCCTRAGKKRRQ